MSEHKKKFINIVVIELEDLIEDLNHLVDDYKNKKEHDVITNYVCMENLALLQHEMYGIKKFTEMISVIKLEDFKNIEEISEYIKELLQKKITTSDFASCLLPMISRRIVKAVHYIENYI
jgi:hypothetical protein